MGKKTNEMYQKEIKRFFDENHEPKIKIQRTNGSVSGIFVSFKNELSLLKIKSLENYASMQGVPSGKLKRSGAGVNLRFTR